MRRVASSLSRTCQLTTSTVSQQVPYSVTCRNGMIGLLRCTLRRGVRVRLLDSRASYRTICRNNCYPTNVSFRRHAHVLGRSERAFSRVIGRALHHRFRIVGRLITQNACFFSCNGSFVGTVCSTKIGRVSHGKASRGSKFV